MRKPRILTALLAASALTLVACGGGDDGELLGGAGNENPAEESGEEDGDGASGDELTGALDGAGATFPNPVYQDWAFEYINNVQPGVTINYQSIGSGGGIEQFLLEQVDWGTSERYLREDALEEARETRGCEALQWPVLFGAVEVAFGDDRFDDLVLTAEVIGDIFERRITNFNHPAIAELNPGFDLPDMDIVPVHRSDGSGTTSVFTTYLEDAADNWTLGSGTEVQWPADTVGGQGNEGVTAGVQQNPGGIGYVNQAYVIEQGLPTAQVVNADGNPVKATLDATTEALEVLEVPDDFQFDILDIGGNGYPIVGAVWNFTWECGYEGNTAELLKDYWTWAVSDQTAIDLTLELGYAPLGEGLRGRVLEAIERTGSLD
jgi:phosphate transport system substrate-binding protein